MQQPEQIDAPEANEIVVSEQVFSALASRFHAQMQRGPSSDEAQALLDQYVRSEVLVREARALGLDNGDGVVRNRLVQKMAFLMTSAAQSAVPEDAVLEQHLREHASKFQTPALVSFEQIGLPEDTLDVDVFLASLNAGEAPPQDTIPSMLQPVVNNAGINQVDGSFGRGVFAQLERAPIGQWSGPIQSGFGVHVVLVHEYIPAQTPSLEDIRDLVLADWRSALADDLRAAQEATLLEAYNVSRPNADTLQSWIGQ
ncbi:peptidylprolyl isomerase [uncultured Shimia sp.]|uniref:peptidylprolyl isomerase n=1 Tax=uncultured Shimia sp. TaxID=573152 RepID=UPI002631E671|nr:peptidylprolyl isomerase [uncultured Shimia sp.]